MKQHILGAILLVAMGASGAWAESINYTINFLPAEGIAPTGSFTYEDAGVPAFTNFVVNFEGLTFDYSFVANHPAIGGVMPCLNSQTGAAASFALLRGDCNLEGLHTIYRVEARGNPFPGTVGVGVDFFSCIISTGGCIEFETSGGSIPPFPQSTGTWTISKVPEFSSLALLPLGLIAIVLTWKYRKRMG